MRVLVIKTSSLGDIIHTLPALTDATVAIPGVRFDWVVEEAFAEIPTWHPAVDRSIRVGLRRWRKAPLAALLSGEWGRFKRAIGERRYDATIDAQGLLKSAFLTRYVSGPIHGLDRNCAREPLASRFYTAQHAVPAGHHAVERVRGLFARALGYSVPSGPGDYGIERGRVLGAAEVEASPRPYLLFLHGTTWATKHWPEVYWRRLVERAVAEGWTVRLPWGNPDEQARAGRLAEGLPEVTVLPALKLAGMAAQIADARACVAVDTGLGHLAAAFGVPTLSLFGPTDPGYTGAWGANQFHLASNFPCAPCLQRRCTHEPTPEEAAHFDLASEQPLCFTRLGPDRAWEALRAILIEGGLPSPSPEPAAIAEAGAHEAGSTAPSVIRSHFDRKPW